VGVLDQYIIPFSGLALGNHEFDFHIGKAFFENIEYSEINGGDVNIHIIMDRQERMLTLHINIEGTVLVPCDRCLDLFNYPVSGQELLIFKFGEDYHEESAEVIIIPRTEHRINLAHILYEMIYLLLPYQKIHPDDADGNSTCDPEILKRLESLQPEKQQDPRWDNLRGINLDKN
jgi:uncharacterized metal-binding protein YceD (DUF177 family)